MQELTLQQLYEANSESDKGTVHSYISEYYEEALKPYRHIAEKVLEIGVLNGGSTKLWSEYFSKAEIIGIDRWELEPPYLFIDPRITYYKSDAYTGFALRNFEQEFDVIIDDGPHTLRSQIVVIEEWYAKLKPGGLLVIEDIQSDEDAEYLMNLAKAGCQNAKLVDLRHIKGRYDDLLIEIRKPA